ncbi:MAG TPA: response regulator, partial [Beijerinckiaceae bacterium]
RAMQPDLALLDVHLADGPTGVELGRRLRAEGCEVVFVTANAKRVPADLAATAGVLGKPYSAGALQRQLHGAHERRGQGAGLSAGP